MAKPIYVLNGPNLNRLGTREPEIYGQHDARRDRGDVPRGRSGAARSSSVSRTAKTQLIEWVHEAIDAAAGIVINPAAFSFTSMALLDALEDVSGADHRAAHLQHPPARADLSPLACLDRGDRGHRRPRTERLPNRRQSHGQASRPEAALKVHRLSILAFLSD